jgi:hypothetical protein
MTNLEQKIWEACESPTKDNCGHCAIAGKKHNNEDCPMLASVEKIDIGLAHVMQLLNKFRKDNLDLIMGFSPYEIENFYIWGIWTKLKEPFENCHAAHSRREPDESTRFEINWVFLNENNEAALFRDQSEETQMAIAKVVGVL